jgi:hypothetical protein
MLACLHDDGAAAAERLELQARYLEIQQEVADKVIGELMLCEHACKH